MCIRMYQVLLYVPVMQQDTERQTKRKKTAVTHEQATFSHPICTTFYFLLLLPFVIQIRGRYDSRHFPPPTPAPHYDACLHVYREKSSAFSSLVDSASNCAHHALRSVRAGSHRRHTPPPSALLVRFVPSLFSLFIVDFMCFCPSSTRVELLCVHASLMGAISPSFRAQFIKPLPPGAGGGRAPRREIDLAFRVRTQNNQ